MTKPTHDELVDEGRHLYDLAVCRGVDAGRYRLIPQPDGETRIAAGPLFDALEPDSWTARQIDRTVTAS